MTEFSAEIAKKICALVSSGKTLEKVAQEPGMPSLLQIYAWLNLYAEFGEAYMTAKKYRAISRSDRLDKVVDDMETGSLPAKTGKAIADIVKWQCEKDDPEGFGQRITQQHTGKDGGDLLLSIQGIMAELPPAKDVKSITGEGREVKE